jgi:hypothetical protein
MQAKMRLLATPLSTANHGKSSRMLVGTRRFGFMDAYSPGLHLQKATVDHRQPEGRSYTCSTIYIRHLH